MATPYFVTHIEKMLARFSEVTSRVVPIADVKTHWAEIEQKMRYNPMTLTTDKGEPKAVLLSYADYREVMQLIVERREDAEDIAAQNH